MRPHFTSSFGTFVPLAGAGLSPDLLNRVPHASKCPARLFVLISYPPPSPHMVTPTLLQNVLVQFPSPSTQSGSPTQLSIVGDVLN